MPRTYEGVLKDDRVHWSGESPSSQRALRVRVTVLGEKESQSEERGERMAQALARLAEIDAFRDIDDPSAWQREVRTDRSLPGRND
jgi:hypothetical protein